MSQLLEDLRCSLRSMTRRPGLTLAAVLTIALGISANAVIFSVLETVLLHPVPFRDADRIAYPHLVHPQWGLSVHVSPSPPMSRAWADGAPSLEGVEIYSPIEVGLAGEEKVRGERVSAEMFDFLGVRPFLGRGFTHDEALDEARVVVLGHAFWQRRFGGAADVLGQSVDLFGQPHTVIGVLPPGIRYLEPEHGAALWLPLDLRRESGPGGQRTLMAIVRLRPAARAEDAGAELDALIPEGFGVDRMYTVLVSPTALYGQVPKMALLLQAAVACVLLIACVNVAQLLLAQGEGRVREMAMRSVLGAGRRRLIRQLLTESLALGLAGGLLALVFSLWGLKALVSMLPPTLRFLGHLEMNGYVLAFAAAAALVSGLVFGLAPALRASSPNLEAALKKSPGQGSGLRGQSLGKGLVTLQVALSLTLLAGAGALINTFVRWQKVGFGFETDDLFVLSFHSEHEAYKEPARRIALADEILARFPQRGTDNTLSAAPVSRVTLAEALPPGLGHAYPSRPEAEGGRAAADSILLPVVSVGPGFFTHLGMRLAGGRDFEVRDREGAERVAIVNVALASSCWGAQDPVGRRFRVSQAADWLRVVGVVENVRYRGLDKSDEPMLFRPYAQAPSNRFEIGVFSSAAPSGVLADLQARLGSLPPNVELRDANSFAGRIGPQLEAGRFHALLAVIFAAFAVVLSAIGIYGVVTYSVVRRRREIGVRMALGAEHGAVVAHMVRGAAGPIVAGIALGLAGAAGLLRALNAIVHEAIRPWDPVLVTALAAGVCLVALVAVWLPARGAAAVVPSEILRHE